MRLLLACTVVCALERCVSTDETLEIANANARAYLVERAAHFANILQVQLLPGTCYTNANLKCICVPPVRARFGDQLSVRRPPRHAIETYTDTVPYGQQGIPIRKTPGQKILAKHYTAFLLDQRDTTVRAAGVTLETVVEACGAGGAYFEAVVRIMNAVESVGVSAIGRFCSLAVELLEASVPAYGLYGDFLRLLALVEWKFDRLFVSSSPVDEIRKAVYQIQEYEYDLRRQDPVGAEKKRVFFESTCAEFRSRYTNMFDYVRFAGFPNMENEHYASTLEGKLRTVINNAHIFFRSIGEI